MMWAKLEITLKKKCSISIYTYSLNFGLRLYIPDTLNNIINFIIYASFATHFQ